MNIYRPDFSEYQFNSEHDLGNYNQAQNRWKEWVSCYKISLSGVPSGYAIKSVNLAASITQQEYTPNNFVANVNKLPNNTSLSTASSNAELLYNAISQTNTSIGSFNYSDTLAQDIKSSITSSDFADSYIIIGVYSSPSLNNSMAKISISLTITYYLPINMTIDNNFVDNSGSGTHGQVSVDGSTQIIPSSGISLTRNIGQSLSLSANSPQQDNQSYQRTWHTGATNPSDWERDYVFRSSNQTYSFSVAVDDGGKTYMANLRKVCNLTFSNPGHSITLNGNNYTSSASSSTVEQNTVTASAEGYFVTDGIEHMFLGGWRNSANQLISSTIITATQNDTYTPEYSVQAINPSISFGTTIGQPVQISWTDNPNASVTQYRVHRRVFSNGSWSSDIVIGTVNRGVQSFTDYDFNLGIWKEDILLEYGLTAYYSVNDSWSSGGANTRIYCTYGASMQNNDVAMLQTHSEVPTEYQIDNYPNPFNPTTTINYQLPENGFVTIKVYDMLGKEISTLVNGNRTAGYHNVTFDASRLTSGIYIYTITANNFVQSKKMLLMK